MRVDWYWQVDKSVAVRPVLKVDMAAAYGRLVNVVFLIDTSSDRTVLDHDTLTDLGVDV